MLTEAISKIESLVTQSRAVKVVEELSGSGLVALSNGSGGVNFIRKPRPARCHVVTSLESFAAAVKLYGAKAQATVWISMDHISCVLDDTVESLRLDGLGMELVPHRAFAILAQDRWMSQKQMVDLLRHDLVDCDIDPDTLLEAIRSLKFSVLEETTGKFQNTSAAMGKSVEAEVTGEIDLPEVAGFTFHPFPGLSTELNVNVSLMTTLFTEPENSRLRLSLQPGEMEESQVKALGALKERLQELLGQDQFPVLLGRP